MIRIAVQTLSQNNAVWSRQLLGFSQRTLGTHGCAVTSLTMLLNTVTASGTTTSTRYSPRTVNEALRERAAFCGPWANYVDWPIVPSIWPYLTHYERLDCRDYPTPKYALSEIDKRLDAGLPVIAYVDASPEKGLQQHFVLLIGKDDRAEDSGGYLINNPWRGTSHPICPQYGANSAIAVCGIIFYDRGGGQL